MVASAPNPWKWGGSAPSQRSDNAPDAAFPKGASILKYGLPQSGYLVVKSSFVAQYDPRTRNPVYVMERLTKESLNTVKISRSTFVDNSANGNCGGNGGNVGKANGGTSGRGMVASNPRFAEPGIAKVGGATFDKKFSISSLHQAMRGFSSSLDAQREANFNSIAAMDYFNNNADGARASNPPDSTGSTGSTAENQIVSSSDSNDRSSQGLLANSVSWLSKTKEKVSTTFKFPYSRDRMRNAVLSDAENSEGSSAGRKGGTALLPYNFEPNADDGDDDYLASALEEMQLNPPFPLFEINASGDESVGKNVAVGDKKAVALGEKKAGAVEKATKPAGVPAQRGGMQGFNTFKEESSIPIQYRARLRDFVRSGYDRGHLACAANHRHSPDVFKDTFSLANISPQVGRGFNRHYWAQLEMFVRNVGKKFDEVVVVSGPLFLGKEEIREESVEQEPRVVASKPKTDRNKEKGDFIKRPQLRIVQAAKHAVTYRTIGGPAAGIGASVTKRLSDGRSSGGSNGENHGSRSNSKSNSNSNINSPPPNIDDLPTSTSSIHVPTHFYKIIVAERRNTDNNPSPTPVIPGAPAPPPAPLPPKSSLFVAAFVLPNAPINSNEAGSINGKARKALGLPEGASAASSGGVAGSGETPEVVKLTAGKNEVQSTTSNTISTNRSQDSRDNGDSTGPAPGCRDPPLLEFCVPLETLEQAAGVCFFPDLFSPDLRDSRRAKLRWEERKLFGRIESGEEKKNVNVNENNNAIQVIQPQQAGRNNSNSSKREILPFSKDPFYWRKIAVGSRSPFPYVDGMFRQDNDARNGNANAERKVDAKRDQQNNEDNSSKKKTSKKKSAGGTSDIPGRDRRVEDNSAGVTPILHLCLAERCEVEAPWQPPPEDEKKRGNGKKAVTPRGAEKASLKGASGESGGS